jgi:hypothetical protein
MQKQKQVIVKGQNSIKRSTEAKENNLKVINHGTLGRFLVGNYRIN